MKTVTSRAGQKPLLIACVLLMALPLAGCASPQNPLWLLHPNGPIARASIYYLVVDVLLLMIVIVPATCLVMWTFMRYRRDGKGTYDPNFNHSMGLEVIFWGIPLIVVGFLAWFTYKGVYAVDPYHPHALDKVVAHSNAKPLKIDVITTDWQWLFVYPDQHIAISNRLIIPTGRKIDMRLTSASVTNDFYILKIVGQIYIMPGMRTEQHFLVDRPGAYRGFSTEFSGPGFAWMNYTMLSVKPRQFQQWVATAQQNGPAMSYDRFRSFAEPTVNTGGKWQTYSPVDPDLFNTVIRNVKSGSLQTVTPRELTEDMHSDLFKRHSTGEFTGH